AERRADGQGCAAVTGTGPARWRRRQSDPEGNSQPPAGLVRPQRCDLILYPEFLSFELVASYVIAWGVFHFLSDGRFETLVTFTQLSNACFQAHQVSPVLRAGGALTGKGFPDFRDPPRPRTTSAASASVWRDRCGSLTSRRMSEPRRKSPVTT